MGMGWDGVAGVARRGGGLGGMAVRGQGGCRRTDVRTRLLRSLWIIMQRPAHSKERHCTALHSTATARAASSSAVLVRACRSGTRTACTAPPPPRTRTFLTLMPWYLLPAACSDRSSVTICR